MFKVMVIDDDTIVNFMLVKILQAAGYDAKGIDNGKNGLQLFAVVPFDLIVTDIVMPEKEGLEFIQTVRMENKSIPIIAISGGGKIGPENYLTMARYFGANFTFEKPVDTKLFLSAVKKCLENASNRNGQNAGTTALIDRHGSY